MKVFFLSFVATMFAVWAARTGSTVLIACALMWAFLLGLEMATRAAERRAQLAEFRDGAGL